MAIRRSHQEEPKSRAARDAVVTSSAKTKPAGLSLIRNAQDALPPTSSAGLRRHLHAHAKAVETLATELGGREAPVSFVEFEKALRAVVWSFAQAAIMLFLALREEHVMRGHPSRLERGGRTFRSAPAIARNLATIFGVVRYSRTYMREVATGARHGFFPLDVALGLTPDRLSWSLVSAAVRLATKLSFAEARSTLQMFVPIAPSTEVIEQAVLGLGRHTAEWFEAAPAPEGDGDVLVLMFDSKGAPTATEEELKRRRGKRKKARKAASPRHRGRTRRKRYPKKPRRKKGDKSKNAKMATMAVMYTLKTQGKKLLGPINRRIYASFAPKRHAFAIARREADKRGFTEASGKVIQIVTDGDNDLAVYAKEFFPTAIHTVDVMHVTEKLWTAGECLYREGSDALREWVDEQRERLYSGRTSAILRELRRRLDGIPKMGPGNKGKRERLSKALRYLERRVDQMHYDKLIARDLEIGSGQVEGPIKNVIGKRFDHGGMRWIKERAEALLQLRCIEVNGDWEAFMAHVHDKLQARAASNGVSTRLQSAVAGRLPGQEAAA